MSHKQQKEARKRVSGEAATSEEAAFPRSKKVKRIFTQEAGDTGDFTDGLTLNTKGYNKKFDKIRERVGTGDQKGGLQGEGSLQQRMDDLEVLL